MDVFIQSARSRRGPDHERIRRASTRRRATTVLKPGGILVTVVSTAFVPARADVRTVFFYAEVTSARLNTISGLLDNRTVFPQVGSVLPLERVRAAHDMLAGAPH